MPFIVLCDKGVQAIEPMDKRPNLETDNDGEAQNGAALLEPKLLLKNQPTPRLWVLELRRILTGDRESELLQLGSVEEYVDKILDLSKDRVAAEESFNRALRLIVRSWRPEKAESKEYFACLIGLIAAFIPPSGVPKLLYFLDRLPDFESTLASSDGYGATSDLYLSALVALEKYFPRPLIGSDDEILAFRSYLNILQKHIDDERYGGYVASRLIELGVLKTGDEQIGKIIRQNPYAMREIISLVFAPERKQIFGRDLGNLLKHSLSVGYSGLSVFERTVADHGGTLVHRGASLVMELNGEEYVPIDLPVTAIEDYVAILKRRELGLDKLVDLLSDVPKRSQARHDVAQTLEQCASFGDDGISLFERELEEHGAQIVYLEGELKIELEDDCYPISLSEESAARYACKFVWSTRDKTREDLEKDILQSIAAKQLAAAG